ncbi:ectoine/hydroxyectoine ABC transporter permease subunit EhuC [Ancylobacter defluvii]|uniref:Ectoine/hydroxyectoine ABC transporter permease subunit EhuC n=1 Tax=Ancylobacter defluvii TaxID=1282440 RepID=A0A9W6NCX4_9HYPH|nr:ectoine/hydroxyectoine ABC transporter permease subunit EhuC [Ancylobacter defluvii]MBS7586807.1 ectoine/hydroxyectoine ABC transporter permease subunit EhuC [Ancylobacter defluvii]GLK86112.1 ectoine/hydroxyectoine ABC transporter permease subunit EhuC [Ancylobacter defluvii]
METLLTTVIALAPRLVDGAMTTVAITLLTAPFAALFALIAGLARLSHVRTIAVAAVVYVELFRGTSLLVQLFFMFYVLPLIGIELSPWTTGVATLALNFGAYGSEIVRGALLAVPRGQIEAALALHMPPNRVLRRVLLPQALPAMLPPFGNQLIELVKATSLLSLITISDLTFVGNALAQTTGRVTTVYILLLAVYFGIAYTLTLAMRALERRYGVARTMAAAR